MTAATLDQAPVTHRGIPLARIVKVELRKMFDTRSGFWLMMSIAILSLIATIAVIAFAPDQALTYATFGTAIGVPMSILLPVMAILSVTGEWSQRTGLTSFTLVPHRGRVIAAKLIAAILVGIASMLLAFVIGVLGNLVGAAINGIDPVWGMTWGSFFGVILANVLGLLIGFMLGILIRNTPGAIVAYFVYSFVLPTIFEVLGATQKWFADIQPWINFNGATLPLFEGSMTNDQWAHLGVSGLIWLVIPLAIGLRIVVRAEVK